MKKKLGKIEDAIEKRIREAIKDDDYQYTPPEVMEGDVMFLIERLDTMTVKYELALEKNRLENKHLKSTIQSLKPYMEVAQEFSNNNKRLKK